MWPPALGKPRKVAGQLPRAQGSKIRTSISSVKAPPQLLPGNTTEVEGLLVITLLNLIHPVLLSAYREKVSSSS